MVKSPSRLRPGLRHDHAPNTMPMLFCRADSNARKPPTPASPYGSNLGDSGLFKFGAAATDQIETI
jgi:hypothetical protein